MTKPFWSQTDLFKIKVQYTHEEIATLRSTYSVGEMLTDDQVQEGKFNFSIGNLVGVVTDLDRGTKRVGLVTGFSRQRGMHLSFALQSATVGLYAGQRDQHVVADQQEYEAAMEEMHVQDPSRLYMLKTAP